MGNIKLEIAEHDLLKLLRILVSYKAGSETACAVFDSDELKKYLIIHIEQADDLYKKLSEYVDPETLKEYLSKKQTESENLQPELNKITSEDFVKNLDECKQGLR